MHKFNISSSLKDYGIIFIISSLINSCILNFLTVGINDLQFILFELCFLIFIYSFSYLFKKRNLYFLIISIILLFSLHFAIILHLYLYFILSIGAGNGGIICKLFCPYFFRISYNFTEACFISSLSEEFIPNIIISQNGGYFNCFLNSISVL